MPKDPGAFRSISEAADELGLAQHTLRAWETKFSFLKPVKTGGGRRFYRPADIDLMAELSRLQREDGLSSEDIRKLHRAGGLRRPRKALDVPAPSDGLARALADLKAAKHRLDDLLAAPRAGATPVG